MPLEFIDLSSPLAITVNCDNQKNKKLTIRNLERTKNYKIEFNCKIRGGVIVKLANKVIRVTKKVIRIIKIDQYSRNNGNTNSNNISKNNINTYK